MLKYRLVEKKNLSKDAEPGSKLFYPVLDSNGRVSFDDLCDEISEQGSLTSGDIKNCVDRLIHAAARHLKEGRSVDMGDFGSLCVFLRSGGAETKKLYDPEKLMRKPKVRYTPGKMLREVQDHLKYQRVDEPETEEPTEPDTGGGEEDLPEVQ